MKICQVYLADFCCFGYLLPDACADMGISCAAQVDDFDVLHVHWRNDDNTAKSAHVYNEEAKALGTLKRSFGHT